MFAVPPEADLDLVSNDDAASSPDVLVDGLEVGVREDDLTWREEKEFAIIRSYQRNSEPPQDWKDSAMKAAGLAPFCLMFSSIVWTSLA